jgi:hypothetical protein
MKLSHLSFHLRLKLDFCWDWAGAISDILVSTCEFFCLRCQHINFPDKTLGHLNFKLRAVNKAAKT